ncbi:MAG: ATP-binding protein [Acidobacteria bacterium]|nr:ATP-binding protein [Acidobacteriota bacterium]
MNDIRSSNLWRSPTHPDVRNVIWASVVPSLALFLLVVMLTFFAGTASESRLMPLALAGCVASAAASTLVAIRLSRQLREVVRQRDAFYQEFARLSKLASLGEASCSIAHDLNNPLAIMNEEAGWMQDLLNGAESDDAVTRSEFSASVEQLRMQIGRCREIARRMLTWTRDPEEPPGQVDINTLLTKTLYLVETDLVATGVRVIKHLDGTLPLVQGHAAELRQVLLHLMKNALDAMKGAGGTLTITTARSGDAVRASISDTGPGIAPDLLGRIFEPFFTTKAQEQGAGLGLTISTWIVQRSGGRIDLDNAPGQGCVFHVTLPAARPGVSPPSAGGAHESRETAAGR